MQNTPQVAIIGGGAAGLTLALLLQQKGIDVTVYEKLLERPSFKRIVSLDPLSLHVYKDLDVINELLTAGYKLPGALIFENDKQVASLNTAAIDKDFPFFLTISLSELEVLLENKVDKLVKGVSLEDITSKGDKKVIKLEGGEEKAFDLVIGADGPKSLVRKLADIGGESHPYPFSLEIANQKVPKKEGHIQMYFEDGKTCALRFPYSDDHIQVIRVIHPNMPSIDAEKTIRGENETVFNLSLEKKLADTFYKDGILLLGDAAHHMTPFGGRALNLSIEDTTYYAEAIANGGVEKAAKMRRKKAKSVIFETHIIAKYMSKGSKLLIKGFKFLGKHPKLFNTLLKLHVNITKEKC